MSAQRPRSRELPAADRHMEDVTRFVERGPSGHAIALSTIATIWSCRTLPFFAESTGGRSLDEIKGIARVKVHPGKLDEWKRLTEQAMEIVRTRDPGTLQYEVFFNDDESEAIVFERYRDADAALEHFANIGHLMEPLMATATVTGEVLGTPNETMRAQLGDGEPKLFTPWMAAHE